jgi:predicted S18 family serine protease
MVLVCLAPESWSVSISTEEHFMAAKKKSVLARRVNELEDAVTRLFTGEPPAAAPKPAKRKKAKRKASKVKKAAKKVAGKVKKAAKKLVRKAKRKAKRKARR